MTNWELEQLRLSIMRDIGIVTLWMPVVLIGLTLFLLVVFIRDMIIRKGKHETQDRRGQT